MNRVYPMKVNRDELDDGSLQLVVTAPPDAVDETVQRAVYYLANQRAVDLIETKDVEQALRDKLGEAQFSAAVENYVANFLAPFAVTQERLEIIMSPRVRISEPLARGSAWTFVVTVIPKPRYELSSYRPVSISLPQPDLTEQEIDEQLAEMARHFSTFEHEADRPVEMGDDIVVDIRAVDGKGEPVEALKAEAQQYSVGQGSMPDPFDAELVGMIPGEQKTFDVTGPGFAGVESSEGSESVTVTVTVTVKEIQIRFTPTIDDAWVSKNLPSAKDLAGLRAAFWSEGMKQKQNDTANLKQVLAVEQLASRLDAKFPDELFQYTLSDITRSFLVQLQQKGLSKEQYFQQEGINEKEFSMRMMLQTRELLSQGFALDAIARHRGISVSDADLTETFAVMAPGHEAEMREHYESTGRMYLIREATLRRKATQWLTDSAICE
jgi:trigger factor